MTYGRQLRLFLADGTSSGPRFYEIVNRTIQALGIPAIRIKDIVTEEWPQFQKPGVYLVTGTTEQGSEMLYIGKGENVGKRVQLHPEKLEFEVTSLLLFSSKDENLNASQVGWLESELIRAANAAKRIPLANIQSPVVPILPRAELATISEFFEDLILIAQTGGYDFFSAPKVPQGLSSSPLPALSPAPPATESPEFILHQPAKDITARGYLSDNGFVVKSGSEAIANANPSLAEVYVELRKKLRTQGVLVTKSGEIDKLEFALDYAFGAPSPSAAVIVGNNVSGKIVWKTKDNVSLGSYLNSIIT